jgi:putative membrane protein
MRNLAQEFMSEDDRGRLDDCIRQAEKRTSGEIVVMVVSSSYHYPQADAIGGVFFALPAALVLMPLVGGWLWTGTRNVWVFLGLFFILFPLAREVVKRTLWLKRRFISAKEIEAEVNEAALTAFFKEGLYRTRDATGVLVLISVFERWVCVLADRGINERLTPDVWEKVVASIVTGIKKHRQAEAICEGIGKIGHILAAHFPIKPDDTDELKGVIIGD